MKQDVINFETAELAKEKGFTTNTVSTKFTNDYLLGGKNFMINDTCILFWMCELQKWLREVHSIFININTDDNKSFYFDVNEEYLYYAYRGKALIFKSYEEALKISLQQALKLIK